MLMVPAMGLLAEAEDDFTIKDGELISYNGKDSVVTIPANVTTIAGGAFKDSNITIGQISPQILKLFNVEGLTQLKRIITGAERIVNIYFNIIIVIISFVLLCFSLFFTYFIDISIIFDFVLLQFKNVV